MKKYSREIKVGLLTVLAIFLLYFGFNFLKGVNIFSKTNSYIGVYENVNGLTEQSPVYVRGYKVGQVDAIQYDFTRKDAFVVVFSIDKQIALPRNSQLALISDGLLGGSALEVKIPIEAQATDLFAKGDTLPTIVEPGLIESLQSGLLTQVGSALQQIDSLVAQVRSQLDGDHIKSTLERVDQISADLQTSSAALKRVMQNDVPLIANNADSAVVDFKIFAQNLKQIDLAHTVAQVDSVVADVKDITAAINTSEGTLGLLLNDKDLYLSLNGAVNSADSLLVDLKKNPKRYVHFSLFGKKNQ